MSDLLFFSSSCLPQLSSFSLVRVLASQSSFLFLFVLHPLLLFLPSDSPESLYVPGRPSPAGYLSGLLSFREPPSLRFTVCPTATPRPAAFSLVLPPSPSSFPSPVLSSRKKFFYNFRIVLFHPSRFFQPRAGHSSVSSLHHQQPSLRPPTSVCVFYFLVFT